MPELSDDMYCSQQICVPPTFPYLLRQYAKAAIRTQPIDLLKWSTAYFRCLSLNLAPPVKPRLEYPIPVDYEGITPGWLKALCYQLSNTHTIDFKVLWDRWTGACLQHRTLIQVLCLGAFTQPSAVPWYRVVALCAAHISENLTQTMILICEILTEEPEGGSSMISVEVFLDLYKFLAAIDASKFQILFNMYFTDDLLGMGEDKIKPIEVHAPKAAKLIEKIEEVKVVEEAPEEVVVELTRDDTCPDIDGELGDYNPTKSEEDLLEQGQLKGALDSAHSMTTLLSDTMRRGLPEPGGKSVSASDLREKQSEESSSKSSQVAQQGDAEVGSNESAVPPPVEEDLASEVTALSSQADSDKETLISNDSVAIGDAVSQLASSKTASGEEPTTSLVSGVVVDTPSAAPITEAASITEVYVDGVKIDVGPAGDEGPLDYGAMDYQSILHDGLGYADIDAMVGGLEQGAEEEHTGSEKSLKYEEIEVEPIPGIGGIVPLELVHAVEVYMLGVAKNQHGFVMPRNIRHYSCPPLEEYTH